MKWLFLALGSMFVQQTFVTLGKVLPSVLAPAIISELHIEASWLGVYVGMIAAVSLLVQAGCGSIIVRYGALRVSQISLLLTGSWVDFSGTGNHRFDGFIGNCYWRLGFFDPGKLPSFKPVCPR